MRLTKLPSLYQHMTKFLKSLYIFLSPLFLACSAFDSGGDKIVDDYEVSWIGDRQQRALYKGEQLIRPYLFAVGHNSMFIFAKRHELILINGQGEVNESAVYYYIIERTAKSFQDKPVYGPLLEDAFIKKSTEIGIEQPKFNLSYLFQI
ncbi:hypothetical protein LZD49_34150 [Dyadobacter sp. CY261]|uniref:hypothetical protein n=1 Tax=Dyadobacter sp. CY261 TaxID=2907203 RepID=UPI001F17B2BF|nr:hypothetical protein [Dyadobacter sp. CY261]MCF0075567.1 hypothetical protein [Dyadobacter sp. CY261]